MRPPPRTLSTDEELYTAALRALMRRSYSVHDMRVYLERRCSEPKLANRIVARLKSEKLIDDARYALEFARLHAQSRKQGRYRIARELRTRGVPDRHIDTAIAQTFAETDEAALVQKVIARRLRSLRGPLDLHKTASLQRTLLRAGFDAETIRRELRAALAGRTAAVPDFPEVEMSEES